jgi:hypothetical protein
MHSWTIAKRRSRKGPNPSPALCGGPEGLRLAAEQMAEHPPNDKLGSGFGAFLQSACDAMLTVSQGPVYICMSSSELPRLHTAFCGAGGHWSTWIVWAKKTFTLGRSDYQRQYEPILYGWREGDRVRPGSL